MTSDNRRPTIMDVAALAGVSNRTVSRVLNRSTKVNEQTRARVEKIIEELNYTPSLQARGLAVRRSYLLGLIYDVPTLFINEIQKDILSVCSEAGYELVVHACHVESSRLIEEVTRFVSRAKVDGVIMLPPVSLIERLAASLDGIGCKYVSFTSQLGAEPWKQVVTNYVPAITDMTSYLFKLGHRRMGFISGPRTNQSSQKRHEAFVQALAHHDLKLPRSMVEEGAFTYESGVRAAEKLLARKDRPTAIFAANDEMAFAVMNVAHSQGLRVPGDLSIVGFDGTELFSHVIPSLTTIRRQAGHMSQLATRKLLALITDGPDAAREFETMVSPQFVPRESTGPAPGG